MSLPLISFVSCSGAFILVILSRLTWLPRGLRYSRSTRTEVLNCENPVSFINMCLNSALVSGGVLVVLNMPAWLMYFI